MSEILTDNDFRFLLKEAIVDAYRFTPMHEDLLAHDAALRAALASEREAHEKTKREREAAEASAEKAEAAHAGCDAQVRALVSKALAAVRGQEAAESRAERLLTALKHLLKAFLMLHRACGTGSAEQWPEVEDARAAIAAEEGK